MITRALTFLKGSWFELKKVIWPSRQMVISHTIIVIFSIALAMIVVALIDYGLANLVRIYLERI